jgi:DNA-binding beta-propeller fold protein YncE
VLEFSDETSEHEVLRSEAPVVLDFLAASFGPKARGHRRGRVRKFFLLALAATTALVAGCSATERRAAAPTRHAARVGATVERINHLEYVLSGSSISVYSIDEENRLVRTISLPQIDASTHGIVASPETGMLYISYGSHAGPVGSLLAYDLRRHMVVWNRHYAFGIDSMAISRDGQTIYMPAGEASGDGTWRLIGARSGNATGAVIHAGAGAHNTIMGASGDHIYLAGVDYPYLEVASTATNQVVRRIGPLNGPGVRPFTINGSETLAFTTATSFLGFQVSDIESGDVLYTVPVPGFSFDPATFKRTPDHGISISPDERELYLIDTPNGYVHVFDISGLPNVAPRDVADIKLAHPPPNDGWLLHSRNGRYVYVGRAGDVIDTTTRKVVSYLAPLQQTADFLEIDWQDGVPVATTSRYGVGYVAAQKPAGM